jgi:hypothetical protein
LRSVIALIRLPVLNQAGVVDRAACRSGHHHDLRVGRHRGQRHVQVVADVRLKTLRCLT